MQLASNKDGSARQGGGRGLGLAVAAALGVLLGLLWLVTHVRPARPPTATPSDAGVAADAAPVEWLRGQVRGPTGAAAQLTVVCIGGAREVPLDADGRFALPAAGRCLARARAEGHVGLAVVDTAATANVVELRPAGGLRGRLVDAAGKPLAGSVSALERAAAELTAGRWASASVDVGADGVFRVPALAVGDVVVVARSPGYLAGAPTVAHITAGNIAEVTLQLARAASVVGLVVDEAGRPIAGAELQLSGEAADGTPITLPASGAGDGFLGSRLEPVGELGVLRGNVPFPPLHAPPGAAGEGGPRSDAAGHFTLGGVPAGAVVVLAAHPDFAAGHSATLKLVAGATAEVRLVLTRGRAFRGRVVDDGGAPVAGAAVLFGGRAAGVSDASGGFQLPHLGEPMPLSISADGFATLQLSVGEADVHADGTPFELRLQRAAPVAAAETIDGVIVDERRMPLANARVSAGAQSAVSDRAGAFRVPVPIDGRASIDACRLLVKHADFAPRTVDCVAGQHIELAPGGGLDGSVRDGASGVVPASTRLSWKPDAGEPVSIPVDKSGRFVAWGLPDGHGELRAIVPGYAAWSARHELPAGRRPRDVTLRDVDVKLERAGTLTGDVRDDRRDPLAGATIRVGALEARSDASGRFTLGDIPVGHVVIEVRHPRFPSWTEEIEVRAGDIAKVALRVP